MRDTKPPFQFNFSKLLQKAKNQFGARVDGISVNLPFISFTVKPEDIEQKVAREIVIRMADRRVLKAQECCDNCIDESLESLQTIRAMLVDRQVDLSHAEKGVLYLLIEYMLEGIRQFLTFKQFLDQEDAKRPVIYTFSDLRRNPDVRERYFAALEMLRAHLHKCLFEISAIANMEIPKIVDTRYSSEWQLEAYKSPQLENS